MFSLQIRRSGSEEPLQLLTAEVVRPGFRHRLTFGRDNNLAEVLHPHLAAFVEDLLVDVIDDGPRVLSQPDMTLSVPGLVLGRLRAIIGAPIGGERQVTLRFRYFIGGIQSAFAARTCFDRPSVDHREEIGMRALEDVAIPLLNMALTVQTWPQVSRDLIGGGVAMTTALASIESHAVELEFYAGLLRRYIQEFGPGRVAQLGRFTDPVVRVMQMAEPPVPALRPRPTPPPKKD